MRFKCFDYEYDFLSFQTYRWMDCSYGMFSTATTHFFIINFLIIFDFYKCVHYSVLIDI